MCSFWPEPPFNILISGTTKCGNTHFVLDLLENKYRSKFDHIIIACPTFYYNKTYNRPFIYYDFNVISVQIQNDSNLKKITNVFADTKEQTLIILDDFANLHDAKVKSSPFTKFSFHAKHSNISCWAITQKYNSIVKDFRQNIQALVLFYDKNKKSRKAAFKENDIGVTSAEKTIL